MEQIGAKISTIREKHKISQSEMARILDVSRSALYRYETGERTPDIEFLIKFTNYFHMTLDDLMFGDVSAANKTLNLSTKEVTLVENYRQIHPSIQHSIFEIVKDFAALESKLQQSQAKIKIPDNLIPFPKDDEEDYYQLSILGKVAGGTPIEIMENSELGTVTIPAHIKADFALYIEGHSMEPKIPDGSIVLVKKQDSIDNHQIGVFFINGENTCKKFVVNNKGVAQLLSLNPDYEPIIFHDYDDARVIGKVVGVQLENGLDLF